MSTVTNDLKIPFHRQEIPPPTEEKQIEVVSQPPPPDIHQHLATLSGDIARAKKRLTISPKESNVMNLQELQKLYGELMARLSPKVEANALLRKGLSTRSDAKGLKLVEEALQQGGDPNLVSEQGELPLHCALSHSCSKIGALLLSHGANPTMQDALGQTAFFHLWPSIFGSNAQSSIELCEEMFKHSALPPQQILALRDREHRTALYEMITRSPAPAFITYLVGKGADPNACHPTSGYTLLHECAANLVLEPTITALIKAGAKIDDRAKDGQTPLGLAFYVDKIEMAHIFIKYGASLDSKTMDDAFRASSDSVGNALATYLLEHGDFSKTDCTKLAFAVQFNLVGEVEKLLSAGAKPDELNQSSRKTLLWQTNVSQQLLIAYLLLESGADPKKGIKIGPSEALLELYEKPMSAEARKDALRFLMRENIKQAVCEEESLELLTYLD